MNGQNNKMTTGISALVLGKQGRHEDGERSNPALTANKKEFFILVTCLSKRL